eukprot:2468655-Pyramimonas_sp.AAC.1
MKEQCRAPRGPQEGPSREVDSTRAVYPAPCWFQALLGPSWGPLGPSVAAGPPRGPQEGLKGEGPRGHQRATRAQRGPKTREGPKRAPRVSPRRLQRARRT